MNLSRLWPQTPAGRGLLMIACGVIFIANVLIWTI